MDRARPVKPTRCPSCGGTEFASILYGYPNFAVVSDRLRSGELVLGGCLVTGNDPLWRCRTCKKSFPKDARGLEDRLPR